MRYILALLFVCCVPVTSFGQCVNGSCGLNRPMQQPTYYSTPQAVTYTSVDVYYPEGAKPTTVATGTCVIKLAVPTDAVVYINNKPTTSTGTNREYKSLNLQEGLNYKYNIVVYRHYTDGWYKQSQTVLMQPDTTSQLLTFFNN